MSIHTSKKKMALGRETEGRVEGAVMDQSLGNLLADR